MAERIFLNLPFAEKDEAKRLGARWDPDGLSDGGQIRRSVGSTSFRRLGCAPSHPPPSADVLLESVTTSRRRWW